MKKEPEECIKITFLGCAKVGKTSVINRLINKCFSPLYEPTLEIERYTYKMNLNEDDTSQVTLVNVLIEDTFALNNSLLNKPPEMIHSPILLQQRKKMTRAFKDIMFTSAEKRNKLQAAENQANANKKKVKKNINMQEEILMDNLGYDSEYIERSGFVFVCDCKNKSNLDTVIKIIEKMLEIEKSNNFVFPKLLLFNKYDKVSKMELAEYIQKKSTQLQSFQGKFKMDVLYVSALTGHGIDSAFKRFLSRIHQEMKNIKQNDGIEEPEDQDDEKFFKPQCMDNLNSCTKNIFCGKRIFTCGEKSDSEEEDN